ncbi:FmdB family zinc ribbon protein [Myceligenerans salitolerans]|uniref:FmdB family transcriptional regulator n=1 Tax=Myceligenerans salitolerans TaxID=1230528 RepID=A0ABS3I8R6_9MICO|nr:FmdB family zinc ribbon protein [Myceligenerans salitolerans]MBO0609390.1 FmdB family transcriptional regulator [Myceligenerans salitolerans]
MPTYAYRCTECDHAFDIHQAFTDDALTACPECSGRLRKVFGSIGVTFKGSGFYRNDSRGSSKAGTSSSNGSSSGSGSSGSSSSGSTSAGSSGSAGSSSSGSSSSSSAGTKAASA